MRSVAKGMESEKRQLERKGGRRLENGTPHLHGRSLPAPTTISPGPRRAEVKLPCSLASPSLIAATDVAAAASGGDLPPDDPPFPIVAGGLWPAVRRVVSGGVSDTSRYVAVDARRWQSHSDRPWNRAEVAFLADCGGGFARIR